MTGVRTRLPLVLTAMSCLVVGSTVATVVVNRNTTKDVKAAWAYISKNAELQANMLGSLEERLVHLEIAVQPLLDEQQQAHPLTAEIRTAASQVQDESQATEPNLKPGFVTMADLQKDEFDAVIPRASDLLYRFAGGKVVKFTFASTTLDLDQPLEEYIQELGREKFLRFLDLMDLRTAYSIDQIEANEFQSFETNEAAAEFVKASAGDYQIESLNGLYAVVSMRDFNASKMMGDIRAEISILDAALKEAGIRSSGMLAAF